MAFKSKKEFADACGMSTGNLSNYIKRLKVVLSGEFIDDTNPINIVFLEKHKKSEETIQNVDAPPKIEPSSTQAQAPNVKPGKNHEDARRSISLDNQIKQLEIEKKGEEITKLQLQNQKAQGDNIPTDLVREVFIRHSKSISSSFKSGVENLIIEFEKMANLTRVQTSKLRGDMINIINSSIENAVVESKKEIGNIVKEFSVKKGVGEHE